MWSAVSPTTACLPRRRVWDTRLLATLHLSDTALVQQLESLPDDALPEPDVQNDPVTWVRESCEIAIHAYPDSATIGADYTGKYLPVAEQRLHLGGERLAQLLNRALTG